MIDLSNPSKFTPDQIAQMKKNAAAALIRSQSMFKILQKKELK